MESHNLELVEKCRLTDNEMNKAVKAHLKRFPDHTIYPLRRVATNAQLLKAIPIIQKAERERMVVEYSIPEVSSDYGDEPNFILLKVPKQALKGDTQ